MGINIIRGEIGSGKSSLCVEMIKKVHEKYPEYRCIMLVPNHYSYETERRFVREFNGTGINNIEVMTLRRLAMSMLDNASLNYITPAGRHMLIHKAIEEYCDNAGEGADMQLIASMKKAGFTDVMSSLISEFKRYTVGYEQMEEQAEKIENIPLKNKLAAAARIYKSYSGYIEASGYTDSEDDNVRLAERIASGKEFNAHTHVWIDSFDEFSPQQRRVIEAIASSGASVTLSICRSEDKAVYQSIAASEKMAFELAEKYGMGCVTDMDGGFKGQKKEDIRFLLENWGRINARYPQKAENISVFSARDIYSEVEKTACRICDLVREDKLRYRDIAILCGSTDSYNHIIETVFDEYKIPYFTDSTIALADHPIAMQLLSVFDIFENDWTYESVFRYLKAGFIYSKREVNGKTVMLPVNPADIDALENYVLKYGVTGSAHWTAEESWRQDGASLTETLFKTKTEENDKTDEIRRFVAEPLVKLFEKTRGKQTAADFARRVFEFLCDINLSSGLKSEIRIMRDEGYINEAEQFTKLWNLLLDVLNQTTVALRDEETDFVKFGEYIEAGLSQCEIRTIPSGIDQVYVGSVEKCTAGEVRVMFIVGANDGTFPDVIPTEGFFSNADRNELSDEYGITIAPDTRVKFDRQYFKVYRAICAVNDKLFISRPVQSGDGKALMPSPLIKDVERLIPDINSGNDIIWDSNNEYMYLSTPEATIHRMLINKSVKNTNSHNAVWDAAYEWYAKREEWRELVSLIDRTKWYMKSDVALDSETARQLYEAKTIYSASRLNTYSQCPFGYFMKYGVRAREREVWEVSPADVGSYAHEVIRRFCELVDGNAGTDAEKLECWKSLSDAERERILDGIIDDMCLEAAKNQFRDKEKTENVLRRTGKNIHNAAKTVHRALSNGKYVRSGLETEFEIPLTEDIGIRGIIDRMDTSEADDETRVRIIDYKTGSTSFDIVNIANGIDMQMVIYAIAAADIAAENGVSARVTGMYYNKVRSQMPDMPMGAAYEDAEAVKEAQLKLDGVTFIRSEEDIYDIDPQMNSDNTSSFLNIEYNSRGKLKNKSSLRSEQEMRGLMRCVTDKIVEIDRGIKEGHISCEPYSYSNSTACGYCSYSEVCAFSNNPCPRKRAGNEEEVWEEMSRAGEKEDSAR